MIYDGNKQKNLEWVRMYTHEAASAHVQKKWMDKPSNNMYSILLCRFPILIKHGKTVKFV